MSLSIMQILLTVNIQTLTLISPIVYTTHVQYAHNKLCQYLPGHRPLPFGNILQLPMEYLSAALHVLSCYVLSWLVLNCMLSSVVDLKRARLQLALAGIRVRCSSLERQGYPYSSRQRSTMPPTRVSLLTFTFALLTTYWISYRILNVDTDLEGILPIADVLRLVHRTLLIYPISYYGTIPAFTNTVGTASSSHSYAGYCRSL